MLAIYRLPNRFFFWKIFIYKNLHIEPFNYALKSTFTQPMWAAQ